MSSSWVYLVDEATGYSYYANTSSGETSWEVPSELGGPSGDSERKPYVQLENGWFQYKDDRTGRSYYYNLRTQHVEWSAPPDSGAARRGTHQCSLEDDYISSDDEAMPPPIPHGAMGGSEVDEDDIDGAEDNVLVQHLDGSQKPKLGREPSKSQVETEAEEAARKAKEKAERRAANRINNLKEFVQSERKYVDKIHVLEKVYVDPLRMVADMGASKGAIFSHADLDAVFLNISVISKVNTKFVEELEEEEAKNWPNVNYAPIIEAAAKKFKGCYTRYVNNFDTADARLNELKTKDKEKHRYLEVQKTNPDAKGLGVRDLAFEPVQRMMRYPMQLKELLDNTEPGHPDVEPLTSALEACKEIAAHINEDKRQAEEVVRLTEMVKRFTPDSGMDKELVRYERKFLREGTLTKARLQRRQKRYCFLFSDLMLYAVHTTKGYQVKGKISLDVDARVERLPNTEDMQHAFAVIEKGGKGYTWLCESAAEMGEWYDEIEKAIRGNRKGRVSVTSVNLLQGVQSKPLEARLAVIQGGAMLMKYNQRDGKSGPRWVKVTADNKICWGDTRTKDAKSSMKLDDAIALLHGAKSSAFFKQQHAKKDQDWLCFSLVFKGRGTLDFAATNADALLDWYLALASKVPHSTEALLKEEELRARIESMIG